jgi:hypothetical protein
MYKPRKAPQGIALQAGVAWVSVVVAACTPQGPDPDEPFEMLADGQLKSNIDLAVECKKGKVARHDWVDAGCGRLTLCYPDGQDFGSVKLLLGLDDEDARLTEDFSAFDRLQVELRGDWDAREIGVTVWTDEEGADQQGRLCRLGPSREWTTVTIPLDYLDPTYEKGHRRYWAPLEVFTDSSRALTVELRAARLLTESGLSAEEVLCPADCECDSLECESMCGRAGTQASCTGPDCEATAPLGANLEGGSQ